MEALLQEDELEILHWLVLHPNIPDDVLFQLWLWAAAAGRRNCWSAPRPSIDTAMRFWV